MRKPDSAASAKQDNLGSESGQKIEMCWGELFEFAHSPICNQLVWHYNQTMLDAVLVDLDPARAMSGDKVLTFGIGEMEFHC